MSYVRDPAEIYRLSFETIRQEADLSGLDMALHPLVIRMIHASGMVDLATDVVGDPDLPRAVRDAVSQGRPVFCDCEMVRSGLITRDLPTDVDVRVTLNHPEVPHLAKSLGTTRSAAAVELWRSDLEGAVVVIGNAPTALFHLIDLLGTGAPRPAAIIATPVGFVGAAESKALLATMSQSIPFLTLRGRRGGSAIAAAAVNAALRGLD